MFRYYSEELLNEILSKMVVVPELYTANWEGEVLSVPFSELKDLLGIPQGHTYSRCQKQLDKFCDDLGALKKTTVHQSKHSAWIWFNFNGEFHGYEDERKAKAAIDLAAWKAKRDTEFQEKLNTKTASIKDGTYGVDNKDAGGVYLLSCGDYYKIGFSKNIKSRLSSIKGSNPMLVELVTKYSPHHGMYQPLESHLHEKFKDSRHQLEWFKKDFTKEDFIEACINFCKEKAS